MVRGAVVVERFEGPGLPALDEFVAAAGVANATALRRAVQIAGLVPDQLF